MTACVGARPRGSSTICLPFRQEYHEKFINDPDAFRAAVDRAFSECPELVTSQKLPERHWAYVGTARMVADIF